jgi:hypothetical protein
MWWTECFVRLQVLMAASMKKMMSHHPDDEGSKNL